MKPKARKITAIISALCVAASVSATAVVSAASNEDVVEPRASRVPYNFVLKEGNVYDNGRATKTEEGDAYIVPFKNDVVSQSGGKSSVYMMLLDGNSGAMVGEGYTRDVNNFYIEYYTEPARGTTVGLSARLTGICDNTVHTNGVWTP